MKRETFTGSTLIPVSCVTLVASLSFWVGTIASEVQANAKAITRVESDFDSMAAEIIQRMESQAVTMDEIRIQQASLDAKVTLLIKWAEQQRTKSHNY